MSKDVDALILRFLKDIAYNSGSLGSRYMFSQARKELSLCFLTKEEIKNSLSRKECKTLIESYSDVRLASEWLLERE